MEYIVFTMIILIVALVIWYFTTYNGFVSLQNKIEEAFSTMDVYLQKRYDLIPNLVETVKGYAAFEKETLEGVTKARTLGLGAQTMDEKIESADVFSSALSRLLAVSEAYPDLKANANFMDLQKQLQSIESELVNARKYYNGVVRLYNTKVEKVPSNIVASIAKYKKHRLFEVSVESARENVQVRF